MCAGYVFDFSKDGAATDQLGCKSQTKIPTRAVSEATHAREATQVTRISKFTQSKQSRSLPILPVIIVFSWSWLHRVRW